MLEGARIGGYRLIRRIGEGGMGVVWMAEHDVLGRRAAIKILHPTYSTQKQIVTRFFNEARAATKIADPGIIQIFDFEIHTDGSAYIVMELLEGEPLDQRLRREGKLSVEESLRICRQVACAVGAAHERDIIHRDLKPENIFMVRDPEVAGGERAKVLDFGIAKLANDVDAKQQTSASLVMGTPPYMSPEQCRGAGKVDCRSDVYSLGCVLYALVTGKPPFSAEGAGVLMLQHMTEPPPRPSTRTPGIPPKVDALILRCLAKNPDERFASGTALAAALDMVMGRPPSVERAMLRPSTSPPTWDTTTTLGGSASASAITSYPRRGRGKWYLASSLGVLAVGVAITVMLTSDSEKPSSALQMITQGDAAPAPVETPASPTPPAAADSGLAQAKADMSALLSAFSKWATEHAGAPCPTNAELGGHVDPWGRAYEVTCTDQPADHVIGVRSLGPDGALETDDDLTTWTLGRDVNGLARGKRWTSVAAQPEPSSVTRPIAKKTKRPTATKPEQAPTQVAPQTGVVDTDGDGIPDQR